MRIQALKALKRGKKDHYPELRKLDARKRKVVTLFEQSSSITSAEIERLFGLSPRTARALCQQWLKEGFLEIVDPSKKARKYKLAASFENLNG